MTATRLPVPSSAPQSGARPARVAAPYTFDPKSARYRAGATGRYVAAAEVRTAVTQVIAGIGGEMAAAAAAYVAGQLPLDGLATAMGSLIIQVHLALAAAGKGGWTSLTPWDFTWIDRVRQGQLHYLDGFIAALRTGAQDRAGAPARAASYAAAGWATYAQAMGQTMRVGGLTEECNRLLPLAEHCDGCLSETARGWVPIGSLTPIGERPCGGHDQCYLDYRRKGSAHGG